MITKGSVDRPTFRAHQHQFTWQILLPMILVALLGLAAGGFVIAATVVDQGQIRVWSDVSMTWLLTPALFLALGILVILITAIYGMAKLLQFLPHTTGKAQDIFALLSAGTRKVADGTTKPIVWFEQSKAAIKSIFRPKRHS